MVKKEAIKEAKRVKKRIARALRKIDQRIIRAIKGGWKGINLHQELSFKLYGAEEMSALADAVKNRYAKLNYDVHFNPHPLDPNIRIIWAKEKDDQK